MTDHRDVVAAFLDREPVEAAALERALADNDAREYFIDLLVLRGLIGNAPLPVVLESGSRAEAGGQRRSVWWLAAAAALVAVGTTGGYMAGRNTTTRAEPNRVSQSASETGAPAPTHVIRLENGVTWNERAGGN
jgi:hypothetical protein